MSSDRTPLLSETLPAFERFMTLWEKIRDKFPNLKPLIEPGLQSAYKYYNRMDNTKAYVVAMCKYPVDPLEINN